jgi:diadenosine tetraphosphate (Ap4A) HIT family hydrolase
MTKKFVNTGNSRSGEYSEVISEIAQKGVCPFCEDQLQQFHKRPIQTRTFWHVTDNMYPYSPTRAHLLLIHRHHITHIDEMSVEAWVELQDLVREETERRNIVGGSLLLRFGDTHFTGSSVSHLHAHIVQSNPEDPDYNKGTGLLTRIG